MPNVYSAKIIENTCLAEGIYSVTFMCEEIAAQARAGQFLHVKCGHSRLLRRPISICSVAGDRVRIVFETKGEGTKWLAGQKPGDTLDILGPLGKGFKLPNLSKSNIVIVGGGIGTPPMLFAAQSAKGTVTAILGFRDVGKVVLADEFEPLCHEVIITTDDGSEGIHGAVTIPINEILKKSGSDGSKITTVLSCGPYAMQKAVAELCARYKVPCQVSLEERMGCGVGACLVCACSTTVKGKEQMSRVCADGPVFDAKSINW